MTRKSTLDLQKMAQKSQPISMVTCYDYTFAQLVERSNIDAILIGDSLGNVIQGYDTTIPVTIEDIIYHTRAVVRGTQRPHIVADLPFLSYQVSVEEGIRNAGRLLKEGFAQSVKVEGGSSILPLVRRLTSAGIPVCGHLGLTPQSVHALGGYSVQGRAEAQADQLLEDAKALQDAGIFMLVLELIPESLAAKVTEALDIPTIGIGAGCQTSGQVLVIQDLLGLNLNFKPKFLKHFANLGEATIQALNSYDSEVKSRSYPTTKHSFQ